MRFSLIAAAAVLAAGSTAASDALPQRKSILSVMCRVNSWQVANPVMKPDDRNWERATWYTGVMAAWKATGDRSFFRQARDWGRQHQWQVGTEPFGANRLFCVQTWAELYFVTKDRRMIKPSIDWLATAAPLSPAGAKRWYLESTRPYVDSLFGAAALAMLAKATGNNRYLETMHAFFDDVTAELFDRESGLYYRDPRFLGKRTENGKKIFWARGNGWAFAGIARLLEYLPEGDPKRSQYHAIFRQMASELIRRQGPDGLWRANLDSPEVFPNPETSGTGFFCYGLAWGVNHGLLDRREYLPAVSRAWLGLTQSVRPTGKVLWGQPVDAQPNPVSRDSTHEYVTGAFLLAGSEVYKLAGTHHNASPHQPVVLNDDGAWCWFQDERALVVRGKVIAGSVAPGTRDAARRGNIEVASYDSASGRMHVAVLHEQLLK